MRTFTCLALLVVLAPSLSPADPGSPGTAAGSAPGEASELLLVGDSVTAGVYFLSLSDESARQGWANRVLERLGLEPDLPRLPETYPLDLARMTSEGFGVAGWRFPWDAIPVLLRPHRPLFREGEPRSIVAVPGQTIGEALRQSSDRPGKVSGAATFVPLLLPRGLTAVETAVSSAREPEWVVVFLGANDLLGAVIFPDSDYPTPPEDYARDLEQLAARLRGAMKPGTPPERVLICSLPDVTRVPLLQPVPAGARGERGPLPEGTKTTAYLLSFRRDRFEDTEVWTPDELEALREAGRQYNEAIVALARREGYTVVDIAGLMERLGADPAFSSRDSPWFSPDLHHPSGLTHEAIADSVLAAMGRVGGFTAPPRPTPAVDPELPPAADLDRDEERRAAAALRMSWLAMERAQFPPWPSLRLSADLGAVAGGSRIADGVASPGVAIESPPMPVSAAAFGRGKIGVRASFPLSGDSAPLVPEEGREVRAGIAVEPIGTWTWRRAEAGLRYRWSGGFGWYARAEWRALYAEGGGDPLAPEHVEVGIRTQWLAGRPGHRGD